MISKAVFLVFEGFRALVRAKVPAIISSITIFITLMIFSIAYFGYINLKGYSLEFRKQYRIDVFFDASLDRDKCLDIFNSILLIDGIEQGDFIDRERAAKIFERYFHKDVKEIVGTNPLPLGGKFEVAPEYRDVQIMSAIADKIRLINGVDLTVFQSGLIKKIDGFLDNLLTLAFIIGSAILIVSIVMVSNTIRLTIHAKRGDIGTLRLLGATDRFIKLPFIIEGLLQGLGGALLSLGTLWVLYLLMQYLQGYLRTYLISPELLIPGNVIIGMALGLIGSYRGISKYLK